MSPYELLQHPFHPDDPADEGASHPQPGAGQTGGGAPEQEAEDQEEGEFPGPTAQQIRFEDTPTAGRGGVRRTDEGQDRRTRSEDSSARLGEDSRPALALQQWGGGGGGDVENDTGKNVSARTPVVPRDLIARSFFSTLQPTTISPPPPPLSEAFGGAWSCLRLPLCGPVEGRTAPRHGTGEL